MITATSSENMFMEYAKDRETNQHKTDWIALINICTRHALIQKVLLEGGGGVQLLNVFFF